MRACLILPLCILTAACGQQEGGGSNDLGAAARQSDPKAAAVLENAAHNGTDPQQALQEAGNAQVSGAVPVDREAQARHATSVAGARPNLPQSPNRKDGSQPPDKVAVPVQH
ncbi:MAG: hypothetical protein ABR588_01660 [Sphingomicrobium sp.]|nr:hypothetical protein [Sphingomonadales bacterium]